ncbi:MAG: 23S rRNA (pseudouridine(1915)-N(3))-methyltransferase RlmH [Firmicutes bacterium]|nr:23S rRNA (pseudouridine(1915)-N(3))-methyltransferase RlmH [Bacillota bacterium]
MKITILCVGKIKEAFYQDALAEYAKRLLGYCTFEIIEVPDEKNLAGQEPQILDKEGQRLLARFPEHAYAVALCIDGKERSSLQLADWLKTRMDQGDSHLVFVIGGSVGLAPAVINHCQERMSFSKLTFPHQLMRVILAEQIYRSFRIIRGEPYHK